VNLHKLALVAALVLGAVALVYNALSIVSGDGGLAGLSSGAAGDRMAQRIW
jgi:hypothetical protein